MTPEETHYYLSKRNQLNESYGLGAAQNNYQAGTVRNAYTRQLGDYARQYDKVREKIPYGFARRGMMNSGLYQKALTDYNTERNAGYANMQGAFNDQIGAYDLALGQMGQVKQSSLTEVDAQQKLAETAALLRGIK